VACSDKRRFLDLIRHFIVFDDDGTSLIKKVAGYHQFHAVNTAISETIRAAGTGSLAVREEPGRCSAGPQVGGAIGDRRIGVVWHTQGSGKSLTMAFYAGRPVLEPAMENPTIVVITNRSDLDHAYDLAMRLTRVNNAKGFFDTIGSFGQHFEQSPTTNFARSVPITGRSLQHTVLTA
jgi:hypothetical protein